MRLFHQVVLDGEYLYGTTTVCSGAELASATTYSLMALVDEVDRVGSLSAWLQHSADGATWRDVSAMAEISSGALATSVVNLLAGSFLGTSAALGPRVRVACRLSGTLVARVRLVVTGRGRGEVSRAQGE
jgi:hypothetical protein